MRAAGTKGHREHEGVHNEDINADLWIGLASRAELLGSRTEMCVAIHPLPGRASVVLPYSSSLPIPPSPEMMRGFGTTDVPFPLEALPSHTVDVVARWRHQLKD